MKTTIYTPEIFLRNLLRGATICLVAASGIIVTACGNSDDPEVEPILSTPISLTPQLTLASSQGGNVTRLAIGATTFGANDVLGLYLAHTSGATSEQPITAAISPQNVKWQNGTYTDGNSLYWQTVEDMHTLYAYFPYAAGVSANYELPAAILADQNAATATADYEAADLLWGKCSTTPTTAAISISMQHCMSQATITIAPGSGFAIGEPLPAISKVELLCAEGFCLSGTWSLSDGSVSAHAATAATTALTTYCDAGTQQGKAASTPVYRAILMPGQVFKKSVDFARVTTEDGTTYTYKLDVKNAAAEEVDLTTAANHTYTFALTLHKGKLDLTASTFSVSSWTTGEPIEGDANMDL